MEIRYERSCCLLREVWPPFASCYVFRSNILSFLLSFPLMCLQCKRSSSSLTHERLISSEGQSLERRARSGRISRLDLLLLMRERRDARQEAGGKGRRQTVFSGIKTRVLEIRDPVMHAKSLMQDVARLRAICLPLASPSLPLRQGSRERLLSRVCLCLSLLARDAAEWLWPSVCACEQMWTHVIAS